MKKLTAFLIFLCATVSLFAQVSISTDNNSPHPSAMLDVQSTNKGALIPRMTYEQLGAIINPANGLLVYCTTNDKLYIYVASAIQWKEIAFGNGGITPPFICGNPFIDSRDGQAYTTILIGGQCWLAENMNLGTQIPGNSEQTNNQIFEKYCYNDDPANCDIYGGLYQWNEMMEYVTLPNTRGICPSLWHIPSQAEWCTMSQFLDPSVNCSAMGWTGTDAGGKIKATGTIPDGTGLWMAPNTGATNQSGFTALPGGYRAPGGAFLDHGYIGFFWSASLNDPTTSYNWGVGFSSGEINRGVDSKAMGFSVRCVKD